MLHKNGSKKYQNECIRKRVQGLFIPKTAGPEMPFKLPNKGSSFFPVGFQPKVGSKNAFYPIAHFTSILFYPHYRLKCSPSTFSDCKCTKGCLSARPCITEGPWESEMDQNGENEQSGAGMSKG